jgi:hypothetical protein
MLVYSMRTGSTAVSADALSAKEKAAQAQAPPNQRASTGTQYFLKPRSSPGIAYAVHRAGDLAPIRRAALGPAPSCSCVGQTKVSRFEFEIDEVIVVGEEAARCKARRTMQSRRHEPSNPGPPLRAYGPFSTCRRSLAAHSSKAGHALLTV